MRRQPCVHFTSLAARKPQRPRTNGALLNGGSASIQVSVSLLLNKRRPLDELSKGMSLKFHYTRYRGPPECRLLLSSPN
jgi:hypothetical protein